MNIFIYSDESGVLDKEHNDFFVFAGIILLSAEEKDIACRKYTHVEKLVRRNERMNKREELKAAAISNKSKSSLFRSVNQHEKFGIVVRQHKLSDSVFGNKKTKQRYLDWAYKYAVKKKLEKLIAEGKINPDEVENVYFCVDEHTTATNGLYELRESLEQEFKYGVHNFDHMTYYPPLFKNLKRLEVDFCDSSVKPLIRASDIIANRLFHAACINDMRMVKRDNFNIIYHP